MESAREGRELVVEVDEVVAVPGHGHGREVGETAAKRQSPSSESV